MNILYISHYFSSRPRHAAEVTTYEIVSRLAKRGHLITIFVPNTVNKQNESSSKIHVYALTHFSSHILEKNIMLKLLTTTLWYQFLLLWVLRKAKEKQFDILITMYHSTHLAPISGYIASRILKLPLFVKEHDMIFEFSHPNLLTRIHRRLIMGLNLPAVRRSNSILMLSEERKRLAEKMYNIKEESLLTLTNGVDTSRFKPTLKRVSLLRKLKLEDNRILLYTGMITQNRALDYLIRAMPLIIEKERKIRLLIVGSGPEQEKIIKLARDLKVDDYVDLIGSVEHSLMPELVSLADVAIGPLKGNAFNATSFPVKVLEYMACGKAVVACHGGVSPNLLIDGYNGTLVHDNDLTELASAILKLVRDERLAKELGNNARKHVEKFHDWNILIAKLDEIIQKQTMRSRVKNRQRLRQMRRVIK